MYILSNVDQTPHLAQCSGGAKVLENQLEVCHGPSPAQHQPSSAQPIFRAATEQREHLPMAVSIVCLCGRMSPIHLFDFPMILTSILPFNQDWVNIQIIATPIVGNAPGLDPHGRGKIHVQHNPFFERSTEWEKRRMIQILNI